MPLIDLKNTNVYFEDGTAKTGAINNLKSGAVNHMAGYAAGATSIVVDGFTGIIPVGSALTINAIAGFRVTSTAETSGNTTTINFTPATSATVTENDVVSVSGFAIGATSIKVDGFTGIVPVGARLSLSGLDPYQVVSTVESGGNTVTITFTPALTTVVADNAVVTIYGVFVRIKVGDGTITWSEKTPREYKLDRGLIDQVRNGDQVPMDVSINFMYEGLTASGSNPPTPEDVLKQRGNASTWISSDTANPCAPYSINIRLDWTPPNCSGAETERVILPYFRHEDLQHNPKDGTVACTGKCNATEALVTRF